MNCYKDKTKEELLIIIENLEKLQNSPATETISCERANFRKKYGMQVLDALADMLVIFDYEGNFMEVLSAPETNHVIGFTVEELIRTDLKSVTSPEAYASLHYSIEKAKATGIAVTGEHSFEVDGIHHYYEHRISVLDDQYLLCACHDISKRVRAKMELEARESEITRLNTLMQAILNSIPVYLFVKDTGNDFRYTYWNKAFAEHSGVSAEEAIGKNDFELFHSEGIMKRFREEDIAALEKGRIEYIEESVSANGEKHIMSTIKTTIPWKTGHPYILGISVDLTEVKKAEKASNDARIKAEEADKLKSAFLANMTHEIRTPLNAIVGFSKLAVEAQSDEEKWMYIDIVETNTKLLLNLLNDILDLSAIEADVLQLAPRPVILQELCIERYDLQRHTAQYGVSLILDEVDKELMIMTDWERLSQVLSNLISNAIKFTQQGEIHFGFEKKDDYIQFYVKDTGIGIPADKIATIFQRFGKVNNFVQGTGLGLALCRMLVEKMGGRIWVRSKQGEGTTFYFTLPCDHSID